jgi:hypothetical protein
VAAEFELVWFRKLAGSDVVGEVELTGFNPAIVFYGSTNSGYNSLPSVSNGQAFPVRPGNASWEIWVAARFNGFQFTAITNISWAIDTFSATGLGTTPDLIVGEADPYFLPQVSGPIDRTGFYLRSEAGPIEKRVDPTRPKNFVPNSAPGFGLGPTDLGGWQLSQIGAGSGIDITPRQSSDAIGSTGSTPFGQNVIFPSNQLPRYSNLAITTFVLADDAVNGTYAPAVFIVVWNES